MTDIHLTSTLWQFQSTPLRGAKVTPQLGVASVIGFQSTPLRGAKADYHRPGQPADRGFNPRPCAGRKANTAQAINTTETFQSTPLRGAKGREDNP